MRGSAQASNRRLPELRKPDWLDWQIPWDEVVQYAITYGDEALALGAAAASARAAMASGRQPKAVTSGQGHRYSGSKYQTTRKGTRIGGDYTQNWGYQTGGGRRPPRRLR